MALVVGAAGQGHEPRVGLMGLTEQQLRLRGLSLADGFDACGSLSAAAAIITASKGGTASQTLSAEAANWAVARTWWHSGEQYASVSSLEAAIARERVNAAVLLKPEFAPSSQTMPALSSTSEPSSEDASLQPAEKRSASREPDCWDIFARQRAGLTQCDDPASAGAAEPRERSHPSEAASVANFGTAETQQ